MVIDPSSGYNKTGISNTPSSGTKIKPQPGTAVQNTKAETTGDGSDSVSLSSKAQIMSRLESAVADTADINESRVAELKQAVEQGTYQVNAYSIAEKMLKEGSLF